VSSRSLTSPLRRLWKDVLQPILTALDRALVGFAGLFGTNIADRNTRGALLFAIFGVIYVLGYFLPKFGLVPLVFGYLGVLAIGRAWVANEKLRTRIAKKLENADPDKLPDLRVSALLSALQLVVLLPLLFRRIYLDFPEEFKAAGPNDTLVDLGPQGADFLTWLAWSFESYSRAAIDAVGLGEFIKPIRPATSLAKVLSVLKALTVDYILIQTFVRWFAINATVREAVAALRNDPDMARRLGRRAVVPLLDRLHDDDQTVRENAVRVLGQVGGERVVGPLVEALNDPAETVRFEAVTALSGRQDPRVAPALARALGDPSLTVRSAAAEGLARLGDPAAVAPLLELVQGDGPAETRAAAIDALKGLRDTRAVPVLIRSLDDPAEDVSRSAATALGRLGDLQAVEPLCQVVANAAAPAWLRYDAARALGVLKDPRAVPTLGKALGDPDAHLRKVAAHALGDIGDVTATTALKEALDDADGGVRDEVTEALGRLKPAEAVPR
jgi:HEAT repeat protein